ncbi:MAG: sugar transferase [Ruminiclostridium sp.]
MTALENDAAAVLDSPAADEIEDTLFTDEREAGQGGVIAPERPERCIPAKKPFYDFVKRAFDIVCSLLAVTVLLPVFAVICVIIMIDDFGNPFFVQDRVGKNGKVFRMIKFRTMYKNAEERKRELMELNESDGVHFKIKHDPRITRIGGFLRKTSIDELPQLFNILAGSMSIIGPRPFIISEQEQLSDDRLSVKPGLSCWWQLTDTGDMPIEEQLELDYRYIRERSFGVDLKIIFLTIASVFGRKNC